MSGKTSKKEINRCELNELIARIEHAIEHDLALSTDDLKLLLLAITTLCELQERMEEDSITLNKLRKLLGMVKQSESRGQSNKNNGDKKKKKRKTKSNKSVEVIHHKITGYQKGDVCPHCVKGKLYKHKPGELLRITGHAPFESIKHITEQFRCNTCGDVVQAPLPESVLADGHADQKYGYSARSLMVIDKFYTGIPYYHQSNLSEIMGCSISASTIFDQCQQVAYAIEPVFYELQRQGANAELMDIDDTHNRILEQQPELREKRQGKGTQMRSGVYSSGLIATFSQGQEIILFETSLGHAGEHLDNLLSKRATELPLPIVMSDALSSNHSIYSCIQSYCNAHCRRLFYDLQTKNEAEIDWFLDEYAKIWINETHTQNESMTAKQRLSYHEKHSLPVMLSLKEWALKKLEHPDFEEHNALGKAIKYLLRHYEKLTAFCRFEKAKLDNNRMEERLKLVIRGRKTAHFYKTTNGANVANQLMSVIATADVSGVNLFDYLCDLQRNRVSVKANPKAWLPWNYQKTLEQLENKLKPDKAA